MAKGLAGLKATDVKKIAEGAIVFRASPPPAPVAPVDRNASIQLVCMAARASAWMGTGSGVASRGSERIYAAAEALGGRT